MSHCVIDPIAPHVRQYLVRRLIEIADRAPGTATMYRLNQLISELTAPYQPADESSE